MRKTRHNEAGLDPACKANFAGEFRKRLRSQQFSFWRGVGQVSDLPVDGVSDSGRGQRPLQPADQEVCPTLLAIMRIADQEHARLALPGLCWWNCRSKVRPAANHYEALEPILFP